MKINYFLLGCTALLFLSCGSRHYAKGSFTLRCAEELLEYVTPEMTYISPKGDTTFVLLTKDKWKKNTISPQMAARRRIKRIGNMLSVSKNVCARLKPEQLLIIALKTMLT